MQTTKPSRPKPTTSQTEEPSAPQRSDQETTDLLAEIDTVLEEDAQEFVSAFVQKGGE